MRASLLAVPVIRTHGPLEGIVSRTELVEVQDKKLDEFHLKDQIDKMTEDLDRGHIIESMNLTGNIHATKFKKFIKNPVQVRRRSASPLCLGGSCRAHRPCDVEPTLLFWASCARVAVQATKKYLQQDDKPFQEETEFFVDREVCARRCTWAAPHEALLGVGASALCQRVEGLVPAPRQHRAPGKCLLAGVGTHSQYRPGAHQRTARVLTGERFIGA